MRARNFQSLFCYVLRAPQTTVTPFTVIGWSTRMHYLRTATSEKIDVNNSIGNIFYENSRITMVKSMVC